MSVTQESPTKERIAKRLARAGVCSRRGAEELIHAGRVSVNGEKLTTPAFLVDDSSVIRVDGKTIGAPEKTRLWLYHKPRGLVTSHNDELGRDTVFDVLPADLPRVISVGRLDLATEGLLLLTNDGALSRLLELPSTGWRRCYKVRAYGDVAQVVLDELENGITVEGIHYGPIEALIEKADGANIWLKLTLREGKNREIRRVLEYLGLRVNRLIRVSYGPFQLGALTENELKEVPKKVLKEQMGHLYPDMI